MMAKTETLLLHSCCGVEGDDDDDEPEEELIFAKEQTRRGATGESATVSVVEGDEDDSWRYLPWNDDDDGATIIDPGRPRNGTNGLKKTGNEEPSGGGSVLLVVKQEVFERSIVFFGCFSLGLNKKCTCVSVRY